MHQGFLLYLISLKFTCKFKKRLVNQSKSLTQIKTVQIYHNIIYKAKHWKNVVHNI